MKSNRTESDFNSFYVLWDDTSEEGSYPGSAPWLQVDVQWPQLAKVTEAGRWTAGSALKYIPSHTVAISNSDEYLAI